MKKIAVLSFVLLLTLVCCVWSAAEESEKTEITTGDYTYIVLDDGTAEITKYSGKAKKLVIPDALDGIKVTSSGDNVFSGHSNSLKSITIPDSVINIGDYAFLNCQFLTGVTIPDSVTSIGANPFIFCDHLTDIIVSPNHPYLATIDGVLFSKPDKRLVCCLSTFTADSYTIPDGIQIIGDDAFYQCASLRSITIPDSVTSIGDYVFYKCESLTALVSRGSYAEQYCRDNNLKYTYAD